MARKDAKRMVLAALRAQGPMSDRTLVWWLKRFNIKENAARRARRLLTRCGAVRWCKQVEENARGQLLHVWEAVNVKPR